MNSTHAKYNPDGSVRVVFAHRNPGVDNYVTTGGHGSGTLFWRWIRAKSAPEPTIRVVKLSQLAKG